jgi:nicotinate-nucleotide adenylyltransferase
MGMDAFLEMHTWMRYRQVIKTVRPVVVTRTMKDATATADEAGLLEDYIHRRLSPSYRYDAGHACWRDTDGNRIHLLTTPPVDVSSSQVRRRIAAGQTVSDLVPAAVNAYIERKGLYR